jgi:hypothetical protein
MVLARAPQAYNQIAPRRGCISYSQTPEGARNMSQPANMIDNPADCARKLGSVRVACAMVLAVTLGLAGCSSSERASTMADGVAAGGATLTADPNPVPSGEGPGTTTITWDTGDGKWGQVYFSPHDKPDKLWQGGAKGSKEFKFITTGDTIFTLYAGKEHETKLATVTVTRPKHHPAPKTSKHAETAKQKSEDKK